MANTMFDVQSNKIQSILDLIIHNGLERTIIYPHFKMYNTSNVISILNNEVFFKNNSPSYWESFNNELEFE